MFPQSGRCLLVVLGIALFRLLAISETSAQESAAAPPAEQSFARETQPSAEAAADGPATDSDAQAVADRALSPERRQDEAAIREAGEQLIKAYEKGDAHAVAELFTDDAEFVDEQGIAYRGRAAIEQAMSEFFGENPGCRLVLNVDDIRFVGPGVAIEEGTAMVVRDDESEESETQFTAVHVKSQGKWRTASLQDRAPANRQQHRAHLRQLQWLVGDWVDEEEDMYVTFSCGPVDGGNFLVRRFTVHIGCQETISGTQRIGWDPLTGKLRTWTFDSRGGFAEGVWHRDGESWVLTSSGVTSEGEHASGMSIYTPVSSNVMVWQAVNHEIGGVRRPDSEPMTIVRRATRPGSATQTVSEAR